jgi:hypothetical protein
VGVVTEFAEREGIVTEFRRGGGSNRASIMITRLHSFDGRVGYRVSRAWVVIRECHRVSRGGS